MSDWGRVLTAMVSPFDAEGRIDEPAVERLVEHLLANGSEGLVVCGTTGEAPTLTHEEKLHMFALVREIIRGRGPVIAGTGDNETAFSVQMSKEAAALGADGLLLVAPYYNKPSQEGLYRHFRACAEAVAIPVMVYNIPGRTGINVDPQTVLRLARDLPNVTTVKEASGNLLQASEILAGAPAGFRLYSGEDGLVLPLLSIGGYGVVSVTSHLVGPTMKAMCEAYASGRTEEAARLHASMIPVVKACFQPTTPSPVPVKAGLNLIGVTVGGVRLPLVEASDRERAIVRAALEETGLLPAAA
ncbi:MAG TPA: 4-hydroxy-tetrahydrodipicolinate synthase [Chthonomonadales bacterium]|nr:4-hydroxy-tetrahydrodipicolinate synthase [Chthonomonadales bacterium]